MYDILFFLFQRTFLNYFHFQNKKKKKIFNETW